MIHAFYENLLQPNLWLITKTPVHSLYPTKKGILGGFWTKSRVQLLLKVVHCRFLVPDNTQKILTEIWQHFWLEKDCEKVVKKSFQNSTMAFRVAAIQCKKICPERLNWPGRLAVISKGLVEFQNKKIRPLFICKPKMLVTRPEILVRLF